METKLNFDYWRINLKDLERSPRLAEIRAVYKSRTKVETRKNLREPSDAAAYLRAIWNQRTIELTEDFVVLCLNNSHQVIGWVKVACGTFASCPVEPRVIFAIALQTASAALVLAHNHPSGDLTPSPDDKALTGRLVEAGRLLNIRILDHVILSKEGSFSFSESGLL